MHDDGSKAHHLMQLFAWPEAVGRLLGEVGVTWYLKGLMIDGAVVLRKALPFEVDYANEIC